jgi:hypothetical protein
MNESNLARSLFTGKQKNPARKKSDRENVKGFTEVLAVEVEVEVETEKPTIENFTEILLEDHLEDQLKEHLQDHSEISKQNLKENTKENTKKTKENLSEPSILALEKEVKLLKTQLLEKNKSNLELKSQLRTELTNQTEIVEALKLQNQQLELKLKANLATTSLLQRSLQEISAQQYQPSDRLVEMESQVAELQEQVLKQAGQAAEYEAAIQHWKEQSLHHQRHALQLSGALDRLMDERKTSKRSTKLEEELALQAEEFVATLPPDSSVSTNLEDNKLPGKVNLPSFLVRQRPALT